MVALQIRDVPDELRDVLARDAAARGQSLQAYLRELLERQGGIARNRALLREFTPIRGTGEGAAVDVVELIAQERRERDRAVLAAVASNAG
ncbi:FitA-like ribbon-helix-helix domain-containing protein [Microbacterium sp.]|uniref:FitA-like ribbon-helix-helix domain-containing protein n=1 Tax=Microbacterium sp. TaxID=51671 RepID=UPI003C749F7A